MKAVTIVVLMVGLFFFGCASSSVEIKKDANGKVVVSRYSSSNKDGVMDWAIADRIVRGDGEKFAAETNKPIHNKGYLIKKLSGIWRADIYCHNGESKHLYTQVVMDKDTKSIVYLPDGSYTVDWVDLSGSRKAKKVEIFKIYPGMVSYYDGEALGWVQGLK